ncbi:transposable element Tcb1 transposase [Trichonephila clavipes]|nr:transposable element Tcb1 transposase [Trichonephila clavipes]
MASLGYQSLPPTDLGQVDEEMASPGDRSLKYEFRILAPNEDGCLAITPKRSRRSKTFDLSRHLSVAIGTTVSKQTVNRRLGPFGLYARTLLRCVPLTATHYFKWSAMSIEFVFMDDNGRPHLANIGLHRTVGASRFNGPYSRQGCVLARTVESNQGGRFDVNESVADSFRSGAVSFKTHVHAISRGFFSLLRLPEKPPVWKVNSLPGVTPSSTPFLSDKYHPCKF